MGDNLGLEALFVVDNLPEPAPPYPGKFRRNNKKGVAMTKEQWIQEQVFQWVVYMKDKPAYSKSISINQGKGFVITSFKIHFQNKKDKGYPIKA